MNDLVRNHRSRKAAASLRFFIASFQTESNTFAPFPTGRAGYEAMGLYFGDASVRGTGIPGMMASRMRDVIEAGGDEVVESVFTFAQPSGRTLQAFYQEIRDRILADLRTAGPIDAVMLWLHGAMVATGCDDCEADMLERIRAVVGLQTPLGAVLDPHAHLSSAMIAAADALIFMKEYPHTDGAARAEELYRILGAARTANVRPVMAAFNTRMIGFYPTTHEPMYGFVRQMEATERMPGILSVSLVHGFPWGDVADVGTRVLVIADGDEALAARTARSLGETLYAMREALRFERTTIEVALADARAADGLFIVADVSDNPGGGAPCDNTAILRALIDGPVGPAALGALWDPCAVETCFEAGLGAQLELRIGGKAGISSGLPVDASVRVEALTEDLIQPYFGGDQSMGRAARVSMGPLQVILCTKRAQTFSPRIFTNMGVDLGATKLVVVKSSQHFEAEFAKITSRIARVDAGGALRLDFEAFPYTKRDLDYWPRVADPLRVGM